MPSRSTYEIPSVFKILYKRVKARVEPCGQIKNDPHPEQSGAFSASDFVGVSFFIEFNKFTGDI